MDSVRLGTHNPPSESTRVRNKSLHRTYATGRTVRLNGPDTRLTLESRRCPPAGPMRSTWVLPNAAPKKPPKALYTRTGAALSYGAMTGGALARTIGMPAGTEVAAAGPFLSLVFLGLVALDAHYTRRDGVMQNSSMRNAQDKLKAAQAALDALRHVPAALREHKERELADDMATWLHDNPALQQQVLTACDTLVDIDTHARAAAANTAKVQIHQSDLAGWRDDMGRQLDRLRNRLDSPKTRLPGSKKRLQRRITQLEERTRMYDTLGPEALKTVFVNLGATQAKQVRDVYIYAAVASTAGPAQIVSAVNTLGQAAGTVSVPVEGLLAAGGLGMFASVLSIFSNYLDGMRDAPRELKRASEAKQLTLRQVSALAETQARMGATLDPAEQLADSRPDSRPDTEAGAGVSPGLAEERRALETALGALLRNRVRRHQELHRLTNQAWIRRIKGLLGMGLGVLNTAAGAATIATVALAVTAGIVSMGHIAIGLGVAGICLTAVYVGSLVNLILFRRKRKNAMRVDEAVARLYLADHSREQLLTLLASPEPGATRLDGSRVKALQLSSPVAKALDKRLKKIADQPALLKANPYLATLVLTEQWLRQLAADPDTPPDPALVELPLRLNVPEVQIMRIRALIRAGQPLERVTAIARQALLSAVGLELKIHDTRHPDLAAAPPASAAIKMWQGVDDSRQLPGVPGAGLAEPAGHGEDTPPDPSPGTAPPAFDAGAIRGWLEAIGPAKTTSPPVVPPHDPDATDTPPATDAMGATEAVETSDAMAAMEARAWALVWQAIKEQSRPRHPRPGGRWRRSSEVLTQWQKNGAKLPERVQRVRQQLREDIEQTLVRMSLPAFPITEQHLDRVLAAATRQAEALGRHLPSEAPAGASSLTPAVRQHYLDVGRLASMLGPSE